MSIIKQRAKCPFCGKEAGKHSVGSKLLLDIAKRGSERLRLTYSKHFCPRCCKHFSVDTGGVADKHSNYTNRVKKQALTYYGHLPSLKHAVEEMAKKYNLRIPATTLHTWVVAEMEG